MCVKTVRLNRRHRPFTVVVGLDPTTATSAGGGDSARKTTGLCGGDARVKPDHDEVEMIVAPYFSAYGAKARYPRLC
jgi:hypothetical protein